MFTTARRRGVHGRHVASVGRLEDFKPMVQSDIARASAETLAPYEYAQTWRRGNYTVARDGTVYFISWTL